MHFNSLLLFLSVALSCSPGFMAHSCILNEAEPGLVRCLDLIKIRIFIVFIAIQTRFGLLTISPVKSVDAL